MRYIWEPHDITPGRRVSAYNRTESYIVVYTAGTGDARYGSASLADGMIWLPPSKTPAEVADAFNKAGMRPDTVSTEDIGKNPARPD